MSEIYGDAFASDKKEDRLYGQSIVESVCSFAYENEIDDIPPLKSNNVSFMKVEDLPLYCRNILAISESYICYSVTQRKNLLRIINTVIGEKVILRGHDSAVLDLKFSPVDSNVLCSVDDGDDVTKSHTMVWEKQEQGDWKTAYELPLKANIVRSHPYQANVWMIANNNNIGIFNAKSAKAQPIKSYDMLPMNIKCSNDEIVTDVSFSSTGLYVVVTTKRKLNESEDDYCIAIYQVGSSNSGSSLIRGSEGLFIKTKLTSSSLLKSLKAVQIIGDYLFAVVSAENDTQCSYKINIWNLHTSTTLTDEQLIQSLHITFPISKSASVSSSLQNPLLECALCVEPSKHRYMILSSRKSHLVACIAINPDILKQTNDSSTSFPLLGLPLYHCTYLHLRAPIVSMDVTTILGQDHHSADQGEHLELCCYQETASDPGQASIQQYHILFSNLFNFQNYLNLPEIKNKGLTEAMIPLATLLEGKSTNIILENSSPTVLTNTETSNSGKTNKGMTILNMLNSFTRNTSNSTTPQMTSPGIVKAPPKEDDINNVTPVASIASTLNSNANNKATGLPEFLTSQTAQPNTSILGMLKAAKSNSATTTSTSAPSNPSNTAVTINAPSLAALNLAAEITATELTKTETKVTSSTPKVITSPKNDVASCEIPSTTSIPNIDISIMLKSFQQNQQSLQKHQQESFQKLVKDLQTSYSKSNEVLAASVKKTVDQDMKDTKESIEKYLSEPQWKNEITENLIRELVPVVTNKVRDSVRDTVKTQLASTFKTCFESALLPAFEAGVQTMFQQMQTVLAQGMQGLVFEAQNTQKLNIRSNEALELEIKSLRETVSRLENSLDTLHKSISLMSQQSTPPSPVIVEDAFTLLSKGLISDAIVRVLEDKDITITIALLDRLTPSQVNAECSHLERLCVTQQLAADMSVNKPIEGIEKRIVWIKSLVLSLLTTKSSSKDGQIAAQKLDPNYDVHFKTMISVVLDSIAAAKEMIFSTQFDNGEEIPGNMQISQAVCTDLQLLEYVIQSKMDG